MKSYYAPSSAIHDPKSADLPSMFIKGRHKTASNMPQLFIKSERRYEESDPDFCSDNFLVEPGNMFNTVGGNDGPTTCIVKDSSSESEGENPLLGSQSTPFTRGGQDDSRELDNEIQNLSKNIQQMIDRRMNTLHTQETPEKLKE